MSARVKWLVTDTGERIGKTRVLRVVAADAQHIVRSVWLNYYRDGSVAGANCVECSGPLQAMSGCCPHAKAAIRWAKKKNKGT